MKRDRQAEGARMLKEAETALRQSLLDMLPRTVEVGDLLFANSQFNPSRLPAHHLSARAEALLDAATACVELREALALPVTGSVGHLYLSACAECASLDEQRRGPRKLAAALLEQLRNAA
jgi:hypothetical protein